MWNWIKTFVTFPLPLETTRPRSEDNSPSKNEGELSLGRPVSSEIILSDVPKIVHKRCISDKVEKISDNHVDLLYVIFARFQGLT